MHFCFLYLELHSQRPSFLQLSETVLTVDSRQWTVDTIQNCMMYFNSLNPSEEVFDGLKPLWLYLILPFYNFYLYWILRIPGKGWAPWGDILLNIWQIQWIIESQVTGRNTSWNVYLNIENTLIYLNTNRNLDKFSWFIWHSLYEWHNKYVYLYLTSLSLHWDSEGGPQQAMRSWSWKYVFQKLLLHHTTYLKFIAETGTSDWSINIDEIIQNCVTQF